MNDFWQPGDDQSSDAPPRRRWVLVICCESCDSIDVSRDTSTDGVAYWSCKGCAHRWREPADEGRGHARLAKS